MIHFRATGRILRLALAFRLYLDLTIIILLSLLSLKQRNTTYYLLLRLSISVCKIEKTRRSFSLSAKRAILYNNNGPIHEMNHTIISC